MSKKIFKLLLGTLIIGSLVGCSSEKPSKNTDDQTIQTEIKSEDLDDTTTKDESQVEDNTIVDEVVSKEEFVDDGEEGRDEEKTKEEKLEESTDGDLTTPTTMANDLLIKITDGVELPIAMPIDDTLLVDFYGIDPTAVTDYAVLLPMMNVQATEIAIFYAETPEGREQVKLGIEKRVKDLITTWESYLPAQLELVQNHIITEIDGVTLFVISEEAETISNNFKEILKK